MIDQEFDDLEHNMTFSMDILNSFHKVCGILRRVCKWKTSIYSMLVTLGLQYGCVTYIMKKIASCSNTNSSIQLIVVVAICVFYEDHKLQETQIFKEVSRLVRISNKDTRI